MLPIQQSRVPHHSGNMLRAVNACHLGVTMRVTAADFIKPERSLADRALLEPWTITEKGHDQLQVLSVLSLGP